MTSNAIRTQGTVIDREDPSRPYVFAPIGEIVAWEGPGGKASLIDSTNLASRVKEKMPGLLEEGMFSITVNFNADDDGQDQLLEDRVDQVLRHFRITFSNAATAVFAAYVMEFKTSGKLDAKVEAAITLEIIDLITWTKPSESRWIDGWSDIDGVADWDLESSLPAAASAAPAATPQAAGLEGLQPGLAVRRADNAAALDRLRANLAQLQPAA